MLIDADHYRIDFGNQMTNEEKVALITSSLLVHYMFLETDLGVCKPTDGGSGCQTTLFNLYCYDGICPCSCSCGGKSGEGGGGGVSERVSERGEGHVGRRSTECSQELYSVVRVSLRK